MASYSKAYLVVNVNLSGSLEEFGKAICYVTKTGCQWRLVPSSYAPWQTIYWYFIKWTLEGVIETDHQILRKKLRKEKGKSESVRMNSISDHQRGINGNKKINYQSFPAKL